MLKPRISFYLALLAAWVGAASLRGGEKLTGENQCLACHGTRDLWEKETLHLFLTAGDVAGDVHWQKGILCHDCHGGNPNSTELRQAHASESGFRKIESPGEVPDFCGRCHSDAKYMQEHRSTAPSDPVAEFWGSVHGKSLKEGKVANPATCTSCHPKHAMRAKADPLSSVNPRRLSETCGSCHRAQLVDLRRGVHHKAGEKDDRGAGTLLACLLCHGTNVHGMVPVDDAASPVFLDHQVEACGSCHPKYLESYEASVHGQGLRKSGLVATAACADCHGAHGTYYAADRRSTLHSANVGKTCGACHLYLEEKLAKSIHGQRHPPGLGARRTTSVTPQQRKPSCTDCHQGHDQPSPTSLAFRRQLPNRCGNCHPDLSQRYRLSLHGELTTLGYEAAAKCSDCHGAHDILPLSNSSSRLAGSNRLQTCRKCHPSAAANFADFDPHANYKDEERYPGLHASYVWTEFVLFSLLGVFAVHGFLWFARSLVQTLKYGRHKRLVAEAMAVVRYHPIDRILYVVLIVSFLGLVSTGLPLKYGGDAWARHLANAVGGFDTTRAFHHFFAVAVLFACVAYVVQGVQGVAVERSAGMRWSGVFFGLNSPLPTRRDFRDAVGMVRWFIGQGEKPTFERWTYWEKFDFWAIVFGVAIIGFSGLVLWFPGLASRFLPGATLNLAKMIHSELALAAGGFLFIIHVFNTHLRPEKFPVDLSLFTGLVSEEHLAAARPEFLERLRREGKLEEIRTVVGRPRRLRAIAWTASLILVVGLALLVGILLVSLGK